MTRSWDVDAVLSVSRGFQPACVLMAAAELDVFGILSERALAARQLAERLGADARATTMLADALTAMGLLTKIDEAYATADGVADVLSNDGANSTLAMVRHHANCLRSWARLSEVVLSGQPAEKTASVRGTSADLTAFIEAMEVASRASAGPLVDAIGPPAFSHLLDVGGGPGTWTIAFLLAAPDARATLYDRPDVIPIAQRHVEQAGLAGRVNFVAGSFYEDSALPTGTDLAWISAIVHQNSRSQNRELLGKVNAALSSGGCVMIRDIVMDESRTDPPTGAMFAINMLVNTPGGGTYTFGELSEDLQAAGFAAPTVAHRDEYMNSVVQAIKP